MIKNTLLKGFLFIFLLSAVSIGCNDDDDNATPECDTIPPFQENIIGEWFITTHGQNLTVEFKDDGTIVDGQNFSLENEINNEVLVAKTYEFLNDSTIRIYSSNPDNTLGTDDDVDLIKNDCDAIDLSWFGSDLEKLRRNGRENEEEEEGAGEDSETVMLLTAHSWSPVSGGFVEDDGTLLESELEACDLDNVHTFASDGTYTLDFGDDICDPDDDINVIHTWSLAADETTLTFVINYTIVSITATELVLNTTFEGLTVQTTYN